jgi:hypothetical protein
VTTAKIVDQPPPVQNDRPAIQDLVIADVEERKRIGMQRYGTLLKPHNGRDALVDLYQEILDAAQYVRQEIEERADHRAEGAAIEREKIVAFLRYHANQSAQFVGIVLDDAADAIRSGRHLDTWPAPPPDSAAGDDANTATEAP